MKEAVARLQYELWCQCCILRFEERARECIPVAKANPRLWGEPKRKQQARSPHKGEVRRVQARGVTEILPETQRSRRGQVEAWRKLRGGPQAVLICKSFA